MHPGEYTIFNNSLIEAQHRINVPLHVIQVERNLKKCSCNLRTDNSQNNWPHFGNIHNISSSRRISCNYNRVNEPFQWIRWATNKHDFICPICFATGDKTYSNLGPKRIRISRQCGRYGLWPLWFELRLVHTSLTIAIRAINLGWEARTIPVHRSQAISYVHGGMTMVCPTALGTWNSCNCTVYMKISCCSWGEVGSVGTLRLQLKRLRILLNRTSTSSTICYSKTRISLCSSRTSLNLRIGCFRYRLWSIALMGWSDMIRHGFHMCPQQYQYPTQTHCRQHPREIKEQRLQANLPRFERNRQLKQVWARSRQLL